MAGEGGREGPDISRRIREELERIREAESRVEEALETVRQARRRVEVVARELGREEERVRAWVREEMKVAGPGGEPLPGIGEGVAARPAETTDERSSGGEGAPRAWRKDASLGWATWRDAARAREPNPTLSREPAPEGALPEDRRPAAPDVESWSVRPTTVREGPAVVGPQGPPAALPPSPPMAALPPAGGASGPGSASPSRLAALLDRRLGFALLAALAVALIGWFAIRGLRQRSEPQSAATQPPTQTASPPAVAPPATAPGTGEPAPAAGPETPGGGVTASPLVQLPEDPAARQALYDSLFAARSTLFDTLLATVQSETSAKPLQRALADWKTGSVDAQDADLIHSALLQHVLEKEIDPRIEIDGQVLRNPCRGRSCSALLNVWEHQQTKYGLPPVPDNAPTDPRALRQAEAVLVLSWLRDANQPGGA